MADGGTFSGQKLGHVTTARGCPEFALELESTRPSGTRRAFVPRTGCCNAGVLVMNR